MPHNLTASDSKLGRRLLIARSKKEWSQRQLEREMSGSITAAYISRIEKGDRKPSLEVIFRLAACLDVDPNWLRFGRHQRQYVVHDAVTLKDCFFWGPFDDKKAANKFAATRPKGEVWPLRSP